MKNTISRREFLRKLSIGSSAFFVLPGFQRDYLDGSTFVLYSDNITQDVKGLIRAICRDFNLEPEFTTGHRINLSGKFRAYEAIFFTEEFHGTKPDMTIIQLDRIIDPSTSEMKNIRGFVSSLRKKRVFRYKVWLNVKKKNIINFLNELHPDKNRVEVFTNGKKVEEFNISKNYKEIIINGHTGKTVLTVDRGRVKVLKSACRHKTCIHEGFKSHGRIVCAPNRVYIKLPDYSKIDAITL